MNEAHHNQKYEAWEKELISMRFIPIKVLAQTLGRKTNAVSVTRYKIQKFPMSEEEVKDALETNTDCEVCQALSIKKATVFHLRKYFQLDKSCNPCGEVPVDTIQMETIERVNERIMSLTIEMSETTARQLFDVALELSMEDGQLRNFGDVISEAVDYYLENRG